LPIYWKKKKLWEHLFFSFDSDSEALSKPHSIVSIGDQFSAAIPSEREVYDMFGIPFEGRTNRRILTDYGMRGHPLQKSFPVTGFIESRWDSDLRVVTNKPVRLAQEMRDFDTKSVWTPKLLGNPKEQKKKINFNIKWD